MLNNCKLAILLFIISISNIYNFQSEYIKSIHISNKNFIFINKDGIYLLIDNNIKEKYIFEKENEKILLNNEIKNIFFYKNIGVDDIIFIFIKNYIYIFNLRGDYIKKCKAFNDLPSDKYYIFPFKYNSQQSYKYHYAFLYIEKNNVVFNIYEYKYISNKNSLLFKNVSFLPYLNTSLNVNFSCNFMLDKSNKTLLTIIYESNKKTNKLSFEIFEMNIEKKIINNYNSYNIMNQDLMTKVGFNFKLINNKDYTKTLICSKDINLINCFIYDSIKHEFTNNINYLNNCDSQFNSFSDFSIDNINNKCIIYCFSSQRTINIVELNEDFQYESTKIYEINDKKKNDELYHLFFNSKNYQLLLFSNENKFQFLTLKELLEKDKIKKWRVLNEGDDAQNKDNNNESLSPAENQNNPENGNDNQDESNQGESNSENKDNESMNKDNESDNQGNNKVENIDNEFKGNGQTGGGYEFDFDNKETNIPKEQIRDNRDDLMNNIKPGETYELKGDGYEIKVAPMGQKEEGSTSIDFLSCEKKLREYYNLSDSDILTVFQTEVETSSERTLTNKIQYVVYDENNTQLNLSVCSDEQIRINYALKENSTLNTSMYSLFYDRGIDILNSSDLFFNDICYVYSDGGSDMILADRIAEIYQNYSLCDSGCDYEGLDIENFTVSCSCSVVANDTDDDNDEETNIKEIILNLFEDSTFGVVKCYKLVFSLTYKNKNIGFWVFLIIIIVHIPLYVLFFKTGISPIRKYIEKEMQKYHYLTKLVTSNPPKKFDNNSQNSEKNINNKNMHNDELKEDNLNLANHTNENINREESENMISQ